MKLTPRDWNEFQHYKERCPPWIKLHRNLLNSREFMCLPLASKALAPLLWLLASEHKDGTFDASIDELVFRLRMDEADIIAGLKCLIDKGFLILASGEIAECLRDDSNMLAQRERQRQSERQSQSSEIKKSNQSIARKARANEQGVDEHFELFWNAYDKKRGRADCERQWARINPDGQLAQRIVRSARAYALATPEKAYRKDPVRWLSHQCWEDEVVKREEPMSSYDKSIRSAGLAIFGNLENKTSEREVYDHAYDTEAREITGYLDKPPF
jgi:hypothetical protein